MTDVQTIFDKVIASGHYRKESPAPEMCLSLLNAWEDDVITHKEYKQAAIEIQDYIRGFSFLSSALAYNGLHADRPSRLALYQDWANRPILTKRTTG